MTASFLRHSFRIALLLGLALAGCATVPVQVPQSLISARASLGVAQKQRAPVLAPEDFQLASQLLQKAERAFTAETAPATVDAVAVEADAAAQIATANAMRAAAEQEYESVEQAIINQQAMLMVLMKKSQALDSALQQLQQTRTEKAAADTKAQEAAALAAAAAKQAADATRQAQDAAKQVQDANRQAQDAAKLAQDANAARAAAEQEAAMLRRAQAIKDVHAQMEARGLVLNLSGKVLFATGSSKLQPGALTQLGQVAQFLKEYPDYHVRIEGHTDSTGTDLSNNTLSQARAESVLASLTQSGVPLDSLAAIGMGSSRPLADNATSAGRQLNRRVEIILENKAAKSVSP